MPEIEGNGCEKGRDHAMTEMENPTRTLTTTVRTTLPGVPVLPVRTNGEIPKRMMMEAMAVLGSVVVSSELDCGDTVIDDLLGTGVSVIASSDVLQRRELQFAIRNKDRVGDSMLLPTSNSGFIVRDSGALDRIGGNVLPGYEDSGDGAADVNADGSDESSGDGAAAADGKSEHVRTKGRAQIRQ